MYHDNTSAPNNLAKALDTPPKEADYPYLSDFLKEVNKLPSREKEANYEYLEANKKWLDGLPSPLSEIEIKKRHILNAYLVGALATRAKP